MSTSPLHKAVARLLILVMILQPFQVITAQLAFAEDLSVTGRKAQALGRELAAGFDPSKIQETENGISLPGLKDGKFTDVGTTIDVNELYPGTSANNDGQTQFFPDGATPDVNAMKGAGSSADNLDAFGADAKTSLYNDANSANPSYAGQAYKLMMDMRDRTRPDLSQDPALVSSRNVLESVATGELSGTFADCRPETTYVDDTRYNRVPDIKICERVLDKSAQCAINHTINARNVEGEKTVKIKVDYWDASGENEWCTLNVMNPDTGGFMTWKGRFRDGMYGTNNPLNSNTCALEFNKLAIQKSSQVFIDLRAIGIIMDPANPKPGTSTYPINFDLAGCGGGSKCKTYVERTAIVLDTVIDSESWSPDTCIDAADGYWDGFASGTVQCSSAITPHTADCGFLGDHYICRSDLGETPHASIDKLCLNVAVDVKYDFYKRKGQCFTDARGDSVCPEVGDGSVDTCTQYQNNEQCKQVTTTCVEGAQAPDGTCYVQEEQWDCGYDAPTQDKIAITKWECPGATACSNDLNGGETTDPLLTTCVRHQTPNAECTAKHEIKAYVTNHVMPMQVKVYNWDFIGANQSCGVRVTNPTTGQSTELYAAFNSAGTANPLGLKTATVTTCQTLVNYYIANQSTAHGKNYFEAVKGIGFPLDPATFRDKAGILQYSTSFPLDFGLNVSSLFNNVNRDFVYQTKEVVEEWSPQSCVETYTQLKAKEAQGVVDVETTCDQMFPENAEGCFDIAGTVVCPGQLATPAIPTQEKACGSVRVTGRFRNTDPAYSTCVAQEQSCAFMRSTCVERDAALDQCITFEETWDCGSKPIPGSGGVSESCFTPPRCMGSDCIDPTKESSPSFSKAVAMLNAAQLAVQDMNCIDDNSCFVFGGQHLECKKTIGSLQDCCNVPTETSPAILIEGLFAVASLDGYLMTLSKNGWISSGYQNLHNSVADGLTQGIDYVTQPFSSYIDSATSAVNKVFDPLKQAYNQVKSQAESAMKKAMQKMFGQAESSVTNATGEVVGDGVSDKAAEDAANTMFETAANIGSTVMAAYTAYMVTVMVVQTVYKCETPEFELAAKKDQKACKYIGSYCAEETLAGICTLKKESWCCFNSPMARIMNTQVKPQIGQSFGSVKHPNCGGIPISDLGRVNWQAVDLSEWIGLLTSTGLMKTATELTMDSLTGSGNTMALINEERQTADERTLERIDDLDPGYINRKAAENTHLDAR